MTNTVNSTNETDNTDNADAAKGPGLAELTELCQQLAGHVIAPGEDEFEVERRVWNGMIDRRPAAIVKCANTADVATALIWARRRELPISVRAGGHNAAGVAVRDGGIVIDVREIAAIDVDAERQTVRAGAGVTIGELDAATQEHHLAVPMGVVTETGIAGLTLGGGYGWLRRKFGLACDNLIGAQVVTADGEVVRASETDHADLFWGLRGGGGNLGIVTEFEFHAHPVGPDVYFAIVIYGADETADALRHYREWAATADDDISSIAVLCHGPELDEVPAEHHGQPVFMLLAMHCGTPSEGEAALAPLRELATPIADLSGPMPYLDVQQFFDDDYPKWEKRYYWTSAYLDGVPDDLIADFERLIAKMPSHESTIDLWHLGGAPSRVAADATAFGDRTATYMVGIEANWEHADDDEANIAWAREVREATERWSTGARYANFPGWYEADESPDFFGPNRGRMARLKARYDPANVFSQNHNIDPAG